MTGIVRMKRLYTERHGQGKPRTAEALDANTRYGLIALVNARVDEEWFGLSFPSPCADDGHTYAGTDRDKMRRALRTANVLWPPDVREPEPGHNPEIKGDEVIPSDGDVFDLLEYAYDVVAKPKHPRPHSERGHTHYEYDVDSGRVNFAEEVNRIFERNGIAFELKNGEVGRIAPAVLRESLAATIFSTQDAALDDMLERARQKFLHRDLVVRKEALEKLWDAWERLKTIELPDKKASIGALLDKAATEPELRKALEAEAQALTVIGNKFMIRHTETDKVPIADSAHVDYLFHRMFAMIRLLLKQSARGG